MSDQGKTAIPYERALLLTGIVRLICALHENEDEVIMEAIRQLEGPDGAHEKVVLGCRLDSKGPRGMWADLAIVREWMGPSYTELVDLARHNGRKKLLAKLEGRAPFR